MTVQTSLSDGSDKMHKAVAHLKEDLSAIRTGRASPAVLNRVTVEYYGAPVPLNQLSTITVPEPRLLMIMPCDKNAISLIEKAIQSSDLGVNPNNDGSVIRLAFPQLTEERRRELVKVAKHKAEEARVTVREDRRKARKDLDGLEKDGDISKDDLERVEKELEKHTHGVIAEIDELLAHKERELLSV